MKIYLAGPINSCSDYECQNWREYIKCSEFKCIDPLRRDYRGIENNCINEIVILDKLDIVNSDIVLVNYNKPSVGTSMEIFYAYTLGKPIVLVTTENKLSPWLKYHCTKIINSFDQALDWIRRL